MVDSVDEEGLIPGSAIEEARQAYAALQGSGRSTPNQRFVSGSVSVSAPRFNEFDLLFPPSKPQQDSHLEVVRNSLTVNMKRFLAWRFRRSFSLPEANTVSSSDAPGVLNLPTEIIEIILSHLDYPFALAFSLTCKQLYNRFFFSVLLKGNEQGWGSQQFLRLLSRDTEDYLVCPTHRKLYAWRKQKADSYECSNRSGLVSTTLCGTRCKRPSSRIMNETTRHLMLRHALYGPRFGVAAKSFDHACSIPGEGHNRIEIKVKNQRLMVRRTLTVNINTNNTRIMASDKSYLSMCLHSSPGYHGLLCAAVRHVSGVRENSGLWKCPLLLKCQQCATDVKMSIKQFSRTAPTVQFDVYQDLGGLDDVNDAQRHVLCDMRQIRFEFNMNATGNKLQRLKEDLSKEFHSPAESRKAGQSLRNRSFLSQWNSGIDGDRWVFHFVNDTQTKPTWMQYDSLPFELQKG